MKPSQALPAIFVVLLPCALTAVCARSVRAQGDAEKTYKAKCVACHAADGSGNTSMGKALKARDFSSPEVQKETDAELASIIANGKGKMPGYRTTLKEAEIKDLVGYIRNLAAKKK